MEVCFVDACFLVVCFAVCCFVVCFLVVGFLAFCAFRYCPVPGAAEDHVFASDGLRPADRLLRIRGQACPFLRRAENPVRDAVPDGLHGRNDEAKTPPEAPLVRDCLIDPVIGRLRDDLRRGDLHARKTVLFQQVQDGVVILPVPGDVRYGQVHTFTNSLISFITVMRSQMYPFSPPKRVSYFVLKS